MAIGAAGAQDPARGLVLVQQAMQVKGVFEKTLLPLVDMRRQEAAEAFAGDMPGAVQSILAAEGVMPEADGKEAKPILDAAREAWEEKHGEAPPEFALEAGWQERAAEVLSALVKQHGSGVVGDEGQGGEGGMQAPKRRRQD